MRQIGRFGWCCALLAFVLPLGAPAAQDEPTPVVEGRMTDAYTTAQFWHAARSRDLQTEIAAVPAGFGADEKIGIPADRSGFQIFVLSAMDPANWTTGPVYNTKMHFVATGGSRTRPPYRVRVIFDPASEIDDGKLCADPMPAAGGGSDHLSLAMAFCSDGVLLGVGYGRVFRDGLDAGALRRLISETTRALFPDMAMLRTPELPPLNLRP